MEQPSRAKRLLHGLMLFALPSPPTQVEELPVRLPGLPAAFCGARLTVVSDVHLPDSLHPLQSLLQQVAATRPDAILLLGDLTNSYTDFDRDGLQKLSAGLAAIAPCFAIPGNHELRLGREPVYASILQENGVCYLCDSAAEWRRGNSVLRLYGMGWQNPAPAETAVPDIALIHKPHYWPAHAARGWPLTVSGHAHGGQIRFGRQGIYAPGQGLFPRFTGGRYQQGDATMLVSRGLGDSSVPWRIHNRPHLPVIVLE